MKIYNVYQSGKRLYIDENENPDNKIVVNKYENEVTTLRLVSDGTLPPRLYWALRNPKLSNKYFILKLVNNEDLIVGTDISAYPGLWDMLLIGTDEDYIIEGTDIDQSKLTYISDHFGRLFVRDNFLEELDFEEQCSPTFKVFYDEILFRLDNIPDLNDIPDKMSDLENDTNFISGVALKDDGEGNVKIVGTTFEGSETEEGGGGNYNLPVANEITLGGVKPLNKTEDMTLDVGVDKNGRLFAKGKDITVDYELDKESTNPVQNKVITAEVKALREENEALEQKNAELEEKNAELESSIEKLQIKTTTSLSPFHHITDSANMKVVDFGMEGKTEQETTSGTNMLDNRVENVLIGKGISWGGVSEYALEFTDRIYSAIFTINVKPNSLMSFLNNTTEKYWVYRVIELDENGTGLVNHALYADISQNSKTYSFTTTENTSKLYVMVRVLDDTQTFTESDLQEMKISVGYGNITAYEPYTGNQPSPNPDYPQEIVNAGKYNEATGRYEIGCSVGNKNLFNCGNSIPSSLGIVDGNIFKTTAQVNGIFSNLTNAVFEENTQYVVAYSKSIVFKDTTITGIQVSIVYTDGTYDGFYMSERGTFGKTSKANKTIKCIQSNNPFGTGVEYENMQIYKLTDGDEYIPPQSQPLTLTSPAPLTKWDKLTKRDGVWGWSVNRKNNHITKVTVDTADEIHIRAWVSSNDIFDEGVSNILRFEGANMGAVDKANTFTLFKTGFTYIYIANSTLKSYGYVYNAESDSNTNKSNAKTALTNMLDAIGGIIITGKTAEEQSFHPLPDEEQTLLNNLETYYGVTNLYNDQGCPMWLCYTCDSKLYVDQKLEQINNALLSLGANV